MSIEPYSEDQRDALQEITNIAMGQAGSSLAQLLDVFVVLSVPRVRIVEVDSVPESVEEMVEEADCVTVARQAFYNNLRGETLVIFDHRGCKDMADLMGHDGSLDENAEEELILDVSNILVGAVLNGLGEQIETDFGFTAPNIMARSVPVDTVLSKETLGWSHALFIEVNFSLEDRGFKCHLIMLMPEESIELMRQSLDKILESF
ncbi:MAG: hypothetical protein D6B27_02600 [Gammaproteobacteria bacterium]|nr:MAG: hypothetical protein D6B27_02600 [Gammaproteobacteria bacterium]